jgi:hypothetical protein
VHSNDKGDVIKLDYEKAFDKVNLDFLDELLTLHGFGSKIVSWIHLATHDGSVAVKLNGVEGKKKCHRETTSPGNHLSPILFNLIFDVFTPMLVKAAGHGMIRGMCPQLYPRGIISLQYADDTILFVENNKKIARNLNWVMSCFDQVFGMSIMLGG